MASSCQEALNSPFEPAAERACAHPGCREPAGYRAPAARDRLREYRWYCLEHVRAFNSGWDYFAGLTPEEIEAVRRQDCTWERPTWKLGSGPFAAAWQQGGAFSDDPERQERRQRSKRAGNPDEARALRELGLEADAAWQEIRSRYKELAKRLHPDATGGNRKDEERLKRVNQAYATLKTLHAAARAS